MIYLLDCGEYTRIARDITPDDYPFIEFMSEDFGLVYEFALVEEEGRVFQ